MDTIILTAGKGTRLHPITYGFPKPLIPLAGKPLLVTQLEQLEGNTDKVIIVIGHGAKQIQRTIGQFNFNYEIEWVIQEKQLGTGHAISMCTDHVTSSHFMVLNGDIVINKDTIDSFTRKSLTLTNNHGLMLTATVDDATKYGCLEIKEEKLVKIHEKSAAPPSDSINAGIITFPRTIFDIIEITTPSERGEIEITSSINTAIKEGKIEFLIHKTTDYWIDIGYPWDVLTANELKMKETITTNIPEEDLPKGVTIIGPAKIAPDVELRPGVYIQGPVVIDERSVIGPNCFIRAGTYIGRNVRIGNAVEIKNSIILENTNIGHLSYIGDSIIGRGCNFGAGTKVANLKLDKSNIKVNIKGKRLDSGRRKLGVFMGDNVKTGINVSLMPGIKIGNNSFIGAHTLVPKDIEPNTLFYSKGEYFIKRKK